MNMNRPDMTENVKSENYTNKFLQKDSTTTTMEVVTQTNAVKSPTDSPATTKLVYTVEEIARMLAISLRSAYNLCNRTTEFRVLRVALQKIFKCPFLVAGIIFAAFLIATFVIGNLTYLVATIAYTILAFITAVLTNIICRILRELDRREGERNSSGCCNRRGRNSSNNNNETQLLSITRRMF